MFATTYSVLNLSAREALPSLVNSLSARREGVPAAGMAFSDTIPRKTQVGAFPVKNSAIFAD